MPSRTRNRKRQKSEKADEQDAAKVVHPLGSALFDPSPDKDDEELELESLVFGSSHPMSGKKSVHDQVDAVPASLSLEDVEDDELFVVDEVPGGHGGSDLEVESASPSDDSTAPSTMASTSKAASNGQKKKSPWHDPADDNVTVSLFTEKRLRKLRNHQEEDEIQGEDYEKRLRQQFERMHPAPSWVRDSRTQRHSVKRRRDSALSEDREMEIEVEGLLRKTDGIVDTTQSRRLPSETLAIERLRDANTSASTEGAIVSTEFLPSTSASVMLSTGTDRRIRLFNIDGLNNPLLHTMHLPDTPSPRAQFDPSGSTALITTPMRPFFYTYDLHSGKAFKSPRSLWLGSSDGNSSSKGSSLESGGLTVAKFSPTAATNPRQLLAIAGRRGYIHLVDYAFGGGQVLHSLKMNSPVKDICWVPSRAGRNELLTIGQDAEVYLWDVGSRRCISRWKDNENFGAELMTGSFTGDYYAVGTSTGIVNVYDSSVASLSSDSARRDVHPLKSITSLRTSISSVTIDRSSQVMAIASNAQKDQLRLVHLASRSTFANWPTSGTPLGTVQSVSFSMGSEYIAIGNTKGRVLLYHMRQFALGA